jgi:hypothetical protein
MSNVIQFLEALGRESAPAASPQAYADAVAALDVDADLRDALLRRDHDALNRLLGARHNVMMILVPAEDEPTPDKAPDKQPENPKIGMVRAAR